jgi:hypothetical protein
MARVVIVQFASSYNRHDVVTLVRPVVAVNQSVSESLSLQVPGLQAPHRQSLVLLDVYPFHYGNRSLAIVAIAMLQKLGCKTRIRAQLLDEGDKAYEVRGSISFDEAQVTCRIVVDSNQNKIPIMI